MYGSVRVNLKFLGNVEDSSYDLFAVGDLDGKYRISSSSVHNLTVPALYDNNLPITSGIVSIAGRSVLVKRVREDNARSVNFCTYSFYFFLNKKIEFFIVEKN